MSAKGTVRVVVLVVPHIELFSRHQGVRGCRQISFALNPRHFLPRLAIGWRATLGLFYKKINRPPQLSSYLAYRVALPPNEELISEL